MPINNPAVPQVDLSSYKIDVVREATRNITTTASTVFDNTMASASEMAGFWIKNVGSTTVYIDISNTVSATKHIISLVAGASFESPSMEYGYSLDFYAITGSGTSTIEVRTFEKVAV